MAIRDVLAEMTKAAQPVTPNASDNAPTAQQSQEMHRVSVAGMERVYELLARDMRAMLGLERLDESTAPAGKGDRNKRAV